MRSWWCWFSREKKCLNNQEWSSQSVTMTSQEDHLCHHLKDQFSSWPSHRTVIYEKSEDDTVWRGNRHLLGFNVSSFWHKLTRVDKKPGTKGSIVVFVASFQPRFPPSEKVFLVFGKFSPLERDVGGLWHSRWKVITDNGAISLQANLTPANQCQPRARP